MQKVFFVDVCNSLADINTELRKRGYRTDIYPGPVPAEVFTYQLFADAQPIQPIIELVKSLVSQDYYLIYLSARLVKFREVTLEWLEKHGLPKAPLIHTNGRLKGEFARVFSLDPRVELVGAIEDNPHEIRSYLDVVPDMELYVPAWDYNTHIRANKIAVKKAA